MEGEEKGGVGEVQRRWGQVNGEGWLQEEEERAKEPHR